MESETSSHTDVENKSETSAADKVWNECLSIIQNNVNSQSFKTWFEPITPITFDGNQLIVRVPSQFFYEWLEEHYYTLISKSLSDIVGTTIKLIYTIETEKTTAFEETQPVQVPTNQQPIPPPQASTTINGTHKLPVFQSYLNSRYLFDNFIKGDSNQLARAAALAVANNPGGTSFNPLVIYGGVGTR